MSDKKICHLLYCPFTGLGLFGGYRGDKWLKNRIRVFKQFVLPSLTSQSTNQFALWLSWRPEDKENPIVQNFLTNLSMIRNLTVIVTWDGVCFWDDKYENDNLLERLEKSLPDLEPLTKSVDYVYMTIQPSDDMYMSWVVEAIQNEPPIEGAVGFKKGYIMNYATKEIFEYNPYTSPPFYTIIFPKDVFMNAKEHMEFTGPYKSHEYVKNFMSFRELKGRGFVVGTHGENISTTINHPYRGRKLSEAEAEAVLIGTGNYFSDPVIVRKGRRLLARQILNRLPYQDRIREFYHSLPEKYKLL